MQLVSGAAGSTEENDAQREGELGFFLRFARHAGLDGIGVGHGNFLSYGALELPPESDVEAPHGGRLLLPAGFLAGASAVASPAARRRYGGPAPLGVEPPLHRPRRGR